MTHHNDEESAAVAVTPDVLSRIEKGIQAHVERKETIFPELVASCPYETYLAVTAFVIEQIVAHAHDGGSFRTLIYERLGCGPDAYVPLYLAGGMVISNEFVLPAAPTADEEARLSGALDRVLADLAAGELRSTLVDLQFRFAELASFARTARSIIERQRAETDALVMGPPR